MRAALLFAVLAVAVPAGAQSLAEVATKEAARRAAIKEPARVITDKDLPAGTAPAKHAAGNADSAVPAAWAASQEARKKTDEDGHDERWWSARVEPRVQTLNAATRRLESARARVEEISAAMDRTAGRARAAMVQRLQRAAADVERRAAEAARARRALEDLEQDARRAGALPGWLRR